MFFEKKRTQQIKESVQEVLEETLHKQEQNQLEQQMGQHHQVCESIEKNQKMIRKLSDTIEDFLDTLQEDNDETKQFQQSLKESAEREQRLVGLIALYQEQMNLLEQWINTQADGNIDSNEHSKEAIQAWRQQYNMLKGQVSAESRLCAIENIGVEGESVDYRLHEVLQAIEAEEKEQEGMVAKVYSSGMLYKGKVIKKARVTAYKKG